MKSSWWRLSRQRASLRRPRNVSDWLLFLRICLFAGALPVLLRFKFPRLESLLEPRIPTDHADSGAIERIVGLVEAALQLGQPFIPSGCLGRGLMRYHFLRRAGFNVALCFGIGRLGTEFVGHCWLVKDGEPFLEPKDPRPLFVEMYRFGSEGRTNELRRHAVRLP
jgi:Transglutaminase-like superfamily